MDHAGAHVGATVRLGFRDCIPVGVGARRHPALIMMRVARHRDRGGAFACREAANPLPKHPGYLGVRHDGHEQRDQVEEDQVGAKYSDVPKNKTFYRKHG